MPYKDPEKRRKWEKKYYEKNKPTILKKHKKYYEKNKPTILKKQKKYNQSPKGKAEHSKADRKYRKTKKYSRTHRRYRKKPEVRAKRRVQAQTYNRKPEVLEHRKKYRQKLEVKAKRKITMKAYLTPKVRTRIKKEKREYSKKPTVKKHVSKKHMELKKEVLTPISKKITNSNVLKCNCPGCKEKMIEFLSIDHIDGREKMGHVGWSTETLYYWIRRQLKQDIIPDGLQVLCHNCNWAKGRYGKCPHQK